jgi:hypothetical protein
MVKLRTMNACCPHPPEEHQLLATCQQVIHYPSEDYPCLCHGFDGDADLCLACDHAKRHHVVTRVCAECSCGTRAVAAASA